MLDISLKLGPLFFDIAELVIFFLFHTEYFRRLIDMLIPIIMGLTIARYLARETKTYLLAVISGLIMGAIAGIGLIPLLYPFMVLSIPWIGVPEIRMIGLFLFTLDIELFRQAAHFLSVSEMIILLCFIISIIGMFAGLVLGFHRFQKPTTSSWID